jgi:hypothetical protein
MPTATDLPCRWAVACRARGRRSCTARGGQEAGTHMLFCSSFFAWSQTFFDLLDSVDGKIGNIVMLNIMEYYKSYNSRKSAQEKT